MRIMPINQAFFIDFSGFIWLFSILTSIFKKIYWTRIHPIIMKWIPSMDSDYEKILTKNPEKTI